MALIQVTTGRTPNIPPLSGPSTKDEDGGRRNDVGVSVGVSLGF